MIEVAPKTVADNAGNTNVPYPRSRAASSGNPDIAGWLSIVAAASLTTGILLLIFGLTIAPDLTWANFSQDGGELITAAVTLGVPHPPGYPTYIVLGKLFSFLPFGTVAFRLNMMSAVSVACAGGLMAALLLKRSPHFSWSLAVGAGTVLGLLPIVWSQATVAEVYGLNLALLAAFLFCLLGIRRAGLAGLFLGLAVTSHLSSLLLLPLAFVVTPSRNYARLAAGIGAGLMPFLLVIIFSGSGSPVSWGTPQTPEGWWWLVSSRVYGANLRLPASFPELRQSLLRPSMWLSPILIGLAIILPGVIRKDSQSAARFELWGLGITAAAFALFALLYQTSDAFVLLIPALFILTYMAFAYFRPPLWAVGLVAALLLVTGYDQQNLRDERAVRPIAESVLTAAPQNAIIVTPGDRSIFTLWYFQHVENARPDLVLVDANLFAFDWYRAQLQEAYPHLRGLAVDDMAGFLDQNVASNQCFTGLADPPAEIVNKGYTYLVGAESLVPYLNCRVSP